MQLHWITILQLTIHTIMALISAYTDLKYRKILNVVVYPAFLAGMALASVDAYILTKNHPDIEWWLPLAKCFGGAFFGFFIFLTTFLLNGAGGGDVKLLTAGGALLGFPMILYVMMYALLTGLMIGLAVIIWQGNLWAFTKRMFSFRSWIKNQGGGLENSFYRVPMGAAYALGTVWAFAMVDWNVGS